MLRIYPPNFEPYKENKMNRFNQKDDIYKDSPYEFIEIRDGFRVTGTDRHPVEVKVGKQ